MKRLDRWSSAAWLILSVGVCIHSYQLGLGSMHNPGPGFLFFWSGAILGGLSFLVLLNTVRSGRAEKEERPFENVTWIKIGSVLLGLILYGVILEWAGFLISTAFFIGFLLYSIEAKKWYVVVLIALAGTLLTYALFELALQSRLPKGVFNIG